MDPLVVFDCQKILADRFALALTAAARSRALNRGAQPRLDLPGAGASETALHEIATGTLTAEEIASFLPAPDAPGRLPAPDRGSCGNGPGAPLARPPPDTAPSLMILI